MFIFEQFIAFFINSQQNHSFKLWGVKENIFTVSLLNLRSCSNENVGGVVASWLVRSTPERAVRVQALAGDIVLCSWARHLTLTVPRFTQVYKWVLANLMLGGNTAMDQHPIQGGVEILSVASYYRNRDKFRPGGPHWPVCRLTFSNEINVVISTWFV